MKLSWVSKLQFFSFAFTSSYLILLLSLFLAVSHFILSSSITFSNQWPISFLILPFTFIFLLNAIHIQDRNRYVVCTLFTALSIFSLCIYLARISSIFNTFSFSHWNSYKFWQKHSRIISYWTCLEISTIFMENEHQRCNKSATWHYFWQ